MYNLYKCNSTGNTYIQDDTQTRHHLSEGGNNQH